MRQCSRSDVEKMTEYICLRIPEDGTRIVLFPAGPEGDEVWADLSGTWSSAAGWDLLIKTNLPEWLSLAEVFHHFRRQDMTSREVEQFIFWEVHRRDIGSEEESPTGLRLVPRWDGDLGQLWCGDHLIKEYREEAENQKAVLAAFQGEGWRHRIDDPLPSMRNEKRAKRRLRDTITGLNQDHITPGVMRFRGDGTGKGVNWYLCE
jgi:hypothetical protein